MLSIYCPKCGATVKFDEDQIPTFCSFCGAHLPDMTDFVKENLKLEIDKKRLDLDRQRHEMQMETMDKEIKKVKSGNFVENFRTSLYMIALIPIGIVILFALFQIIRLSN